MPMASPLCFSHAGTAGGKDDNTGVLYLYAWDSYPETLLQEAPGISIHCHGNTIGIYWKVMVDDWNSPDLICSSLEHPGAFPLAVLLNVGENMVSISKFFLICVQDERAH